MTRHNAALNHQRDLQHAATVNAAQKVETVRDTAERSKWRGELLRALAALHE